MTVRPAATDLREYVARSRAAQGLPATVQDPAALERVAAILRLVLPAPSPAKSPRRRRRRPPAKPLAELSEGELRAFVSAEFAKPPAEGGP